MDTSEDGVVEGRLYGFEIGSASLLFYHRIWLDNHVVPVLAGGGTVGMTGLASRSGSAAFNQGLSVRRAKAVLQHLRLSVGRQLSYSLDAEFEVKGVNGVGEELARQSGQKDGTEDPYQRAVLVTAWSRPTPPPPPQPKPKVDAPKVKRVASRKWSKFNSRMPGEDGEAGMEWGEIASDIVSGVRKGGSDDRTYVMVPSDYVITHIRDEFIVDNDMGIGVSTTWYKETIEYRWGPPDSDMVFLLKRTKEIENGHDYGWKTIDRDHYKRSEVWQRTVSPDATVFW